MSLRDIRRRPGMLFAAVVLVHVGLISTQVNSRSGVPVLEGATLGALTEVQTATAATVGTARSLWREYIDLRGVRAENSALREQLGALQLQLQEQRAVAARSLQLHALLGLRDGVNVPTIAADIVGIGAQLDFRTVTIDKGQLHGLAGDMAVISPAGVVGRVVTPSARAAKVQLLIDRNAAAGAIIERSRVKGVVFGTGESLLRMDYVEPRSDLQVGDAVVTSGDDQIYPKGLLIGEVERIEQEDGDYRLVTVRPAVDLRRLESVLVVNVSPAAPDELDALDEENDEDGVDGESAR